MGATFPCAVHPAQAAIIDATHRAFVNYEVYYFSSEEALLTFAAEPWSYTGKVTDPVTRARFQPSAASPRRTLGGRLFYFENDANATTFDSDPSTYGIPRPTMHEKS
ncbi:MAG TPA: hypothetical protein VFX92_14410 [Candidatus Krumholzibacteria bacterium]|nr:hypothetical protein [Candidatus Krumholzibacteria bacterium]